MRFFIQIAVALTVCLSISLAAAQNKVVVVPFGGAVGDAVPNDVVEGKTFSSKAGKGLAGTRSNGVLSKTGQTLCYDPACIVPSCAPVACAGTGEDGEFQTGVTVSPRFTDNGDGTVTDRVSGLVWLQEGKCSSFFSGDTTGGNARPWGAALEAANKLVSGYCGLTDGTVAGDWRLPNIRELQSLIDFNQFTFALPPGHPFLNTEPAYYWSSTTYAYYPSYAWHVNFGYGGTGNTNKSGSYNVRAVRGGQ